MKKVVIVGVGALGSHVTQLLRNEATIKVVDHDRVETKNTLSQFHGKPHVGKNKAQALQQSFQFLFGVKLDPIPHRLISDNAEVVLFGADLMIDCLDNAASRQIVQGFARANKIPCLHGALAENGAFGRVAWDDRFEIDTEDATGAATCEDGEHLPFIGVVSALLAKSAQDFLRRGRRVGFEISPSGVILVI